MKKAYITNNHIISTLGFNSEENFNNLLHGVSGIKEYERPNGKKYFTSLIDKEKINEVFSKIAKVENYTILEQMMILSVKAILDESKLKITNKTGLIISTTKGNIDALASNSNFFQDKKRAYLSELGNQIQRFFGFKEEAIVLSNACVSGVLAVSVAKHLIQSNKYDELVVVSGDLVSEFILSGFESFQAISSKPCKPYSKNRTGITIGEAIASVLVSKNSLENATEVVEIIGTASCNDANHISGPSRTGEGLFLSVQSALKEAQIKANQVDYISAHGTATNYNDEMESIAFDRLAMNAIPLNSLKGFYGHTLGASGLLETIIGIKSLYQNTLIQTIGFDEIGVSKPLNIIQKTTQKELNIFLKTASGFGGSNSAALFKKIN